MTVSDDISLKSLLLAIPIESLKVSCPVEVGRRGLICPDCRWPGRRFTPLQGYEPVSLPA